MLLEISGFVIKELVYKLNIENVQNELKNKNLTQFFGRTDVICHLFLVNHSGIG